SLTALADEQAIRESLFSQPENDLAYFFAFHKDSLFAWSDNDVLFAKDDVDSLPQGSLLKLKNGWYELLKLNKGDLHLYAAVLIKHEFAYQNKFLVNSFSPKLKIPGTYNFYTYPAVGTLPVKNMDGRALFYISPGDNGNAAGIFSLSG